MPEAKQILETIINDKREFGKTPKNHRNLFKGFKKIKKAKQKPTMLQYLRGNELICFLWYK